jgi:hypothetical protein
MTKKCAKFMCKRRRRTTAPTVQRPPVTERRVVITYSDKTRWRFLAYWLEAEREEAGRKPRLWATLR